MSDDKPPARTALFRLTPRDGDDLLACLEAVGCVGATNVAIVVDVGEAISAVRKQRTAERERHTDLERQGNKVLNAILEEAAEKARRAAAKEKKQRILDEAEISAIRKGLGAHLKFLGVKMVRITLEIYRNSLTVATGAIKRFFDATHGGGHDDE